MDKGLRTPKRRMNASLPSCLALDSSYGVRLSPGSESGRADRLLATVTS
jgi:hypothetical protein